MPPSDASREDASAEVARPAGVPGAPPESVDPDDLLLVGRVLKAHANGGEVKVIPETDDPARFEALETVYLSRVAGGGVPSPRAVESVRHQTTKRGPLVLLKLAGVDDRAAAEALRQQQVYAAEEDLPPLGEEEAFIHDLVGLAVVTEAGERLGTVQNVEPGAAHDLFIIAREGDTAEEEPAMVPAVEEFVREVDFENGRLVVRPIEGLF